MKNFDKKLYGKYSSGTSLITYEINEMGIYVISTNVSSMSREMIRESSTYDVRNGYIFGVVKNDSVPCILEGDRYYFGVRNSVLLYGVNSLNTLTQSKINKKVYYVNTFDNGYYIPTKLEFNGRKLIVSNFDYELNTDEFDFIHEKKSIQTKYHELVVLSPSEIEMSRVLQGSSFENSREYKRD